MRGRFAPSPTGTLHLGNLRTALLAWLFARSAGSNFVLRFEDLDGATVKAEHYDSQRRDLELLGIDWDGELCQSDHLDRYRDVLETLAAADLTYPCFCSRREIREAASAPHSQTPDGGYPGTCRSLSRTERAERHRKGIPAAVRLRAAESELAFDDIVHGPTTAMIDDVVLARRDGTPAYNLVVVVDDHHQRIEQVVRGDDLLASTARHLHLADVLDMPRPAHAHVPLVLGPDGSRLAKRDGAVTLEDRMDLGESPDTVRNTLLRSAGLDVSLGSSLEEAMAGFDPAQLHRTPWQLTEREVRG